ncbi:MAG: copper homeostasis protein CutC, partial [Bacteroidota bacterium]
FYKLLKIVLMKKQSVLIEVCANGLESALAAHAGGAQRLELCCALELGGLTPSPATIQLVRQQVQLPLFVLIRPRAGDFCYRAQEWAAIEADIHWCKERGVDGIVCGALLPDGQLDVRQTRRLIEWSHPLPFTFHRAFDCLPDPFKGLEQLIDLGAHRVLTSGQASSATAGKKCLQELVEKAADQIVIMGGAGIQPGNVRALIEQTGLTEIHLSAKKKQLPKSSVEQQVRFNQSDEEGAYWLTDEELVRQVRTALD